MPVITFKDKEHPLYKNKIAEKKTVSGKPEFVGTALSNRISGFLNLKGTGSCGCKKLQAEMDQWGIAGCEEKRQLIVASLLKNRDMLVDAISKEGAMHSIIGWFAYTSIADSILEAGANWLLDRAIEDVKKKLEEESSDNQEDHQTEK